MREVFALLPLLLTLNRGLNPPSRTLITIYGFRWRRKEGRKELHKSLPGAEFH